VDLTLGKMFKPGEKQNLRFPRRLLQSPVVRESGGAAVSAAEG
jgi:hypothetical protein